MIPHNPLIFYKKKEKAGGACENEDRGKSAEGTVPSAVV
jgi:hypothetical protein